jgi:tetratricopeptide (TPR) repeat protein
VSVTTSSPSLPDRYAPIRHIANGGMAGVWAADDRVLGREVAIKLLAEQFVGDVAAKARFEREARAAASLSSHPNVVTIFDVAEHAGRPFIVMELLNGGTVADALRRESRRVPRERALDWLAQAAEALDAAHAHGIVHRDVKPANLLTEGKRLAVADFGIARIAWETGVTQTGEILGTAAYISPEQAQGRPASAASDRYALAVVAYELLTGARPFEGAGFAAQARAHVEDEPLPASARDPALPAGVDSVLARGLAKRPSERWPSAAAMVSALREALDHGPVAAGPATEPRTAVMAPVAALGRLPDDPPGRRPGQAFAAQGGERRSRRLVLAALGVAALAVAAVIALASGGGGGSPKAGSHVAAARASTRHAADPVTPASRRAASNGTAAAQPASGATASPPASPAADAAAGAGDLNAQGYALLQHGRYAEAIPLLQRAAQGCPVAQTDPCAFALFNLGEALVAAGRPAEAVPVFQQRLQNPDQRETVQRALLAAQAQAQAGPRSRGPAEHGPKLPKPGKHGRKHGR